MLCAFPNCATRIIYSNEKTFTITVDGCEMFGFMFKSDSLSVDAHDTLNGRLVTGSHLVLKMVDVNVIGDWKLTVAQCRQ